MKKTKTESAYQKMLLVTPLVYQKLLNCIDEKDKVSTEELNIPTPGGNKTPSEKIIEGISDIDVGIQTAPEVGEMGIQVGPETGDFGAQANPQTSGVSIGTETTPMQSGFTQTDQQVVPISTQTDYPEQIIQDEFIPEVPVSNNPLKIQCPQDTNEGSIIPSLFYRPSFKTKKNKTFIKKTQLRKALEQVSKPIAKKPIYYSDPSSSKLNQVTFEGGDNEPYDFDPPLDPYIETRKLEDEKSNKRPLSINMRTSSFSHPAFPCSVCGHMFTRKHDLQRHLASKTVHNKLNLKSYVQPSSNTTQPISTTPPQEEFDLWNEQPSTSSAKPKLIVPPISAKPKLIIPPISAKPKLIVPSILKQMDTTSQKVLGKRSHSKAKLGNLRYPRKLIKDNPIEQEEFDSWTF